MRVGTDTTTTLHATTPRAAQPITGNLAAAALAPHQAGSCSAGPRDVRAALFRFGGKNAETAGIVGSQGRDEYVFDDLEQYFNYMGFLAEEGTYDRMEALTKRGLHPIDSILLLAASQNDTPKIQEILNAGADVTVVDAEGRTPLQLATKAETVELLRKAEAKLSQARA